MFIIWVLHCLQLLHLIQIVVFLNTGCPSGPKGRRCKALDQSWINRKACLRETCTYEEGNMYPEVSQSPYGRLN